MFARRPMAQRLGPIRGTRRHGCAVHTLEPLEGRALLSRGPWRLPLAVPAHVQSGPNHHPASTHQPLMERVNGGHVVKHPRFNPTYTGPRLPSLNGTGAFGALFLGVGYRFTGTVAGPIDPSQPATFAFGVNRGGAKAPMSAEPPAPSGSQQGGTTGGGSSSGGKSLVSFPNRPNIFVDALVTVAMGPQGVRGAVQLMTSNGGGGPSVPLPADDVQIVGNDVFVLVPARLLPPNGAAADRYYYSFWTASGDPTAEPNVASFVPEYNITPIAVRPR